MHGSQSAPAMSATIHHRGSHDVGAIKGQSAADDLYVPRALWTEAVDSPMRLGNRCEDWNPRQFLKEEAARRTAKDRLRTYLVGQYNKQGQETMGKTGELMAERKNETMTLNSEMTRHMKMEATKLQEIERNKQTFRDGLAEQTRDLQARARQAKAQEAREAYEMKLRNTQQLCDEMARDARMKQQAKQNQGDCYAEIQARELQRRTDRANEVANFRTMMRETLQQDEMKANATASRVQANTDKMQARADNYERTAGKQDRERYNKEGNRQDMDEKRHNLRMDIYLARREQARERQRQHMVRDLNAQVEFLRTQRTDDSDAKRRESEALTDAVRRNIESEAAKAQHLRNEELERQSYNLEMAAEKQRKEMASHYKRPPQTRTMHVASALPSSPPHAVQADEFRKRVDAARYVAKPLGRADLEPWTQLTNVGNMGHAPAGSLPADSPAPPQKVMSKSMLLARNMQLVARDHRFGASWTEGLSPQDLHRGRLMAKKRESRAAIARSDWQ